MGCGDRVQCKRIGAVPYLSRYRQQSMVRGRSLRLTAYVELHSASAFSFLDGASLPEEFAGLCSHFQIPAIALLDRDGVYGAPHLHLAAKKAGVCAHIGAELTGHSVRYPLLAECQMGYQNLCRLTTRMKMRAGKEGEGAIDECELEEFARGLVCLT